MEEDLEIQFWVSSNVVHLKDIESFKIGLRITNIGDQNIKVDVSRSKLYVNGVKNLAWDLRVQNGAIVNLTVLAGQSKTELWSLGKALFNATGVYDLELKWGELVKKQMVVVSDE